MNFYYFFHFIVDFLKNCGIITLLQILGNCVTVARQTLTLFVGVRIPIPQPKIIARLFRRAIIFCFIKYGIRTRAVCRKANCNTSGNGCKARGQRAKRGGGRVAPEKSLFPSQKRSNFCLSKVTSFFIQAAGLVYHHALACISSPQGVYHHRRCILLRLDEIQHCVLVIYNASH